MIFTLQDMGLALALAFAAGAFLTLFVVGGRK